MNNKPTSEPNSNSLCQELELLIEPAGDIKASVYLLDRTESGRQIINGTLRGPRCATAKTLPATLKILPTKPPEGIVPDPCYWSPTLPMLYDLSFDSQEPNGEVVSYKHSLGLRRLEANDQNLLLNRERIVLRGGAMNGSTINLLPEAHEQEVALIACNPSIETVQHASQLGVFIIADLREVKENLQTTLRQLAIEPAVAAVIINDYSELNERLPHGLLLAQAVGPNDGASTIEPWANLVIVELNENETPGSDLASCDKPMVAVQRNNSNIAIENIRSECDKLQARLAPEFSLAGYFVSV